MAFVSVAEARDRIRKGVKPLRGEAVSGGPESASPVKAQRPQPPFDASAMDGYAVLRL